MHEGGLRCMCRNGSLAKSICVNAEQEGRPQATGNRPLDRAATSCLDRWFAVVRSL